MAKDMTTTTLVLYAIRPSSATDAVARARAALVAFPGIAAREVDEVLNHIVTSPYPLSLTLTEDLAGTFVEYVLRDAFYTEADRGLELSKVRARIASQRELSRGYRD